MEKLIVKSLRLTRIVPRLTIFVMANRAETKRKTNQPARNDEITKRDIAVLASSSRFRHESTSDESPLNAKSKDKALRQAEVSVCLAKTSMHSTLRDRSTRLMPWAFVERTPQA